MIAELLDGRHGRRASWSASAPAASPASASASPPPTAWRSAGARSVAECRRWRCSPPARRSDGRSRPRCAAVMASCSSSNSTPALQPVERPAQPAAAKPPPRSSTRRSSSARPRPRWSRRAARGEARDAWPSRRRCAARCPTRCARSPPRPLYARAPDATRREAACMSSVPPNDPAGARQFDRPRRRHDDDDAAFDPRFGEAWTRSQCAGILPMTGRRAGARRATTAAAAARLCAVPDRRRRGRAAAARGRPDRPAARASGASCSSEFVDDARERRRRRVHLEVRDGNPARSPCTARGFRARRPPRANIIAAATAASIDALTFARTL